MKYTLNALLVVAAIILTPSLAVAASDSDSCGLGWQITAKKSFLGTSTRGTTNVFVPPTFGMTSGTIGCAQHSIAQKDEAAATFAVANFESLRIEMAEGRGENLAAFAQTMGCADAAAFAAVTKARYSEIMANASESPLQMFRNVQALQPCGT